MSKNPIILQHGSGAENDITSVLEAQDHNYKHNRVSEMELSSHSSLRSTPSLAAKDRDESEWKSASQHPYQHYHTGGGSSEYIKYEDDYDDGEEEGARYSIRSIVSTLSSQVSAKMERVGAVVSVAVQPKDNATGPAYSKNRVIFACLMYILFAASEYWLVNWLKAFGVNLPVFFFLVQNSSWPIQYFLYRHEVKKQEAETGQPRVITREMYKSYLILGLLASVIGLTRMYGLSYLPATLYVICANTEIVFETIMTKFILMRDITNIQMTAVSIVVTAVVISLYNPDNNTYAQSDDDDATSNSNLIMIGVLLSIISRFSSSLNTILAERLLGKDVKSKVGVNECAVANAIIPFILTPVCFSWTQEYKHWGAILTQPTQFAQAVVILLLITLSLSKQVDRLSKFAIVGATSTIFFAGVDSFMKMIAGIGCFVFFGDLVTWANLLGICLISFSVVLMFYEKYNKLSATVPTPPLALDAPRKSRMTNASNNSSRSAGSSNKSRQLSSNSSYRPPNSNAAACSGDQLSTN